MLNWVCSALEPKEMQMKDDGKRTARDFSPYDLNAVAKVAQGIRDSLPKPSRPGEPYNVGSTPRTLSLGGRTKNR